ncbi:pirin family protein, partial [Klebsiella michiganensis]
MKQITGIYTAPSQHWVGDGFPVRSMFSYQTHGEQLSPFLLLDYAGPHSGAAGQRDSTGRGGVIGPGDVQWMTAGAGILHEEFHSAEFTRAGGELKMIQLWVNLPAYEKVPQ